MLAVYHGPRQLTTRSLGAQLVWQQTIPMTIVATRLLNVHSTVSTRVATPYT